MKNRLKLMAVLVAMLCFLSACTVFTSAPASDERLLSDAQRFYRGASAVVMGECVALHTNASGVPCCDLVVDQVLAGTAAGEDDIIHCTQGTMKEGETYLLYLGEGEDVHQSEDNDGYTLLTEAPLRVSQRGLVQFANGSLSMEAITAAILQADSVVTIPSVSYYHKTISGLAQASEQIFIGRVVSVPAFTDMRFRSHEDGASVENTLPASLIEVEAYGSVKGALRYGERIKVVYCPAMCGDVIDAATLKPVTYDESRAPVPEKDGVYLFFLTSGPDAKQSYYFGVNPLQAIAKLDRSDSISVTYVNRALSGYRSLSLVIEMIKEAIKG